MTSWWIVRTQQCNVKIVTSSDHSTALKQSRSNNQRTFFVRKSMAYFKIYTEFQVSQTRQNILENKEVWGLTITNSRTNRRVRPDRPSPGGLPYGSAPPSISVPHTHLALRIQPWSWQKNPTRSKYLPVLCYSNVVSLYTFMNINYCSTFLLQNYYCKIQNSCDELFPNTEINGIFPKSFHKLVWSRF